MNAKEREHLIALRDRLLRAYDETTWRKDEWEETYDDAWLVPGNEDARKIAEAAIEGIEQLLGLESTLQKRRDEEECKAWHVRYELREQSRRQTIDSIARAVHGKVDTYLCEFYDMIPREMSASIGDAGGHYAIDEHEVTAKQYFARERVVRMIEK
jgi:hypothetical protein